MNVKLFCNVQTKNEKSTKWNFYRQKLLNKTYYSHKDATSFAHIKETELFFIILLTSKATTFQWRFLRC